ncbi:MAG: Unknown protein [uncultured Thiotrichaceae bacterium]|uniref:Glycosyltransferase n=1 Tax=uncultured Thiotrichaceae bacterium TaxID=298394 RepID=A0A6S6TVV6_9GAMM|nr:MAG: Unknown protein [uncultured Thiotrichaceae bacterium]
MRKINILHITTAFTVGGAEKVILDLILTLDKNVFNNSVMALAKNPDMLGEFLDHGIKAEKLDMDKGVGAFVKAFRHIDKYISENKIDIIHAHLFHPLPLASLLKLKHPKLKVVFTSHNTNIGGKLREVITQFLKPLRNKDIVFSEDMITPIYKKDTLVIANGVNIEKFQEPAAKNTPFTFLSVGTVRAQKNQLFLVECAKALKEKGYDFVIDIVGGGEENRALIETIQKEIVKQDVQKHVRMLGVRNDIPDLLKTAHCMVLPSHYEGLPIVLLEAGAAKIPIISTPVGAIPTLINEDSGYLTDLDTFCETMGKVYNDYAQAEEKAGVLAEKIDQHYSIKSMAKAHAELYQSLIV